MRFLQKNYRHQQTRCELFVNTIRVLTELRENDGNRLPADEAEHPNTTMIATPDNTSGYEELAMSRR